MQRSDLAGECIGTPYRSICTRSIESNSNSKMAPFTAFSRLTLSRRTHFSKMHLNSKKFPCAMLLRGSTRHSSSSGGALAPIYCYYKSLTVSQSLSQSLAVSIRHTTSFPAEQGMSSLSRGSTTRVLKQKMPYFYQILSCSLSIVTDCKGREGYGASICYRKMTG